MSSTPASCWRPGHRTGSPSPVEVFLQPLSPFGVSTAGPSPDQVLQLHERALRIHPRVRVVPQTHKAIGQL